MASDRLKTSVQSLKRNSKLHALLLLLKLLLLLTVGISVLIAQAIDVEETADKTKVPLSDRPSNLIRKEISRQDSRCKNIQHILPTNFN